ncbi:hypothetical protein J5N97_028652 [Dioscorea zingiberensis]|uniref:Pollen Ole e 1 allergen and extensin family protein n=1 Tax=Dioscorea zingiberensis TaxID=325984 RepID=A0A9D5BZB0_9LILI|nr:hypothetical protein J5N97_028652 [Dioscorea zingiberensis]
MGLCINLSTLLFLAISGIVFHGSAARRDLPKAMVVGTVYCDTCFHNAPSKSSHLISGATVAVECAPSFRKEVTTNEQGEFQVNLPLEVSKHIKRIKACNVKLISSNEPFCAVASSATSSNLRHVKSNNKSVHIFSAGFFTFKPLKQPEVCYQKPKFDSVKEFAPFTGLPPFQLNMPPLPQLPPLPSLPNLPLLPNLGQPNPIPVPNLGKPNPDPVPVPIPAKLDEQKQSQPTTFFLPNPSPVPAFGGGTQPPNPFRQPTILPPPPLNLPRFPFQTPPPPFPISSTPPPPAGFRFPQFPFPPNPLFPGFPPSFPSKKVSP